MTSPTPTGAHAPGPPRDTAGTPVAHDPVSGPVMSRYLYAVGLADAALEEATATVPGLFGAPLRVVAADGLGALVSDVPAADFDEAGLAARLEDLERLEELARGHDAVVTGAYGHTTVLPMRLATVYLDDARVAEVLTARGPAFRGTLERLRGHQEWGVKVYARPPGPGEAPSDGPEQAVDASPGRAYLRRRRAQRDGRQEVHRAAGGVAARIAEAVGRVAVGRVTHRPQQGALATGAGAGGEVAAGASAAENTANEAYLVPVESVAEFRHLAREAAEGVPGVEVVVTGPWAPYSFATPPDVEADR